MLRDEALCHDGDKLVKVAANPFVNRKIVNTLVDEGPGRCNSGRDKRLKGEGKGGN